jgi:hypothetical protein
VGQVGQVAGGAGAVGGAEHGGQAVLGGDHAGADLAVRDQRGHLGGHVAELGGEVHGLLRDLARLLGLHAGEAARHVGQQHHPLAGGRHGLEQPVRLTGLGHAVADAGVVEELAEPHQQAGGAKRLGLGVQVGERGAGELERALVVAGLDGGERGLLEEVEVVGAEPVAGVGHLLPQLEDPLQQAGLFRVRVPLAGVVGRLFRGDQGPRVVVRGVPVVGDLGGCAAHRDQLRLGLDRLRVAAVQAGVLAGQQVVVHRLADERVAELVPPVGVHDDELGRDDGPQGRLELGLAEAGDAGEQVVAEPGAADRSDPQHPLGHVGQLVDPGEQQVAQAVRDVGAGRVAGERELLDEERVALGALVDRVDGARFGFGAEQLRQQRGGGLAVEAFQLQALDAADAVQLGEEGAQRVAALQLVGAVRDQQQHVRQPRRAHQEADQVAGGPVGPVQVLQDEHQRLRLGQPGEQRRDQVEQVAPADLVGVRRGAQLGQQPGELALAALQHGRPVGVHELAQRGRERRERQALLAELERLPGEDPGAVGRGDPAELLHQAGLAHARLAADQDGRRLGAARAFQRIPQRGQVGLAADENLTSGMRRHGVENATGVRQKPPSASPDHAADGARTALACRAARPKRRWRPPRPVPCASR